jgi:hypothetical protein
METLPNRLPTMIATSTQTYGMLPIVSPERRSRTEPPPPSVDRYRIDHPSHRAQKVKSIKFDTLPNRLPTMIATSTQTYGMPPIVSPERRSRTDQRSVDPNQRLLGISRDAFVVLP